MGRSSAIAEAVRPSQLLLALSAAADMAEGHTPGHARRVAALARLVGAVSGLSEEDRALLVQAGLLHDLGLAAVVGSLSAALPHADEGLITRLHADRRALSSRIGGRGLEAADPLLSRHPREGAALVEMAPLPTAVSRLVLQHHERWDGAGYPDGMAGREIPKLARILGLADLVESAARLVPDPREQAALAARRLELESGVALDPELVEAARGELGRAELWRELDQPDNDELLTELPDRPLDSEQHSTTLFVDLFGSLVDHKCSFTRRHSMNVARLVSAAGPELGMSRKVTRLVTRAARVHDLGQIAVSSRVLEKSGSLAPRERSKIQEHPSVTAWILAPVSALRQVVRCAEAHHERLDGSGYPRGVPAEEIPLKVRLLSAADAYEALTAERPFRGPLSRSSTLDLLRNRSLQYDRSCIEAVGDATADRNLLDGQGY